MWSSWTESTPVSKGRWALLGMGFFSAGALVTASVGHTYASFSDFQVVHASASAGTWGPPTPAVPTECQGMSFVATIVVPAGQTVYHAPTTGPGGAHDKGYLIFANASGDTITGSQHDDCIVGGAGDDVISGGQGEDVLLGGAGDDTLNGQNGKDYIDGGPGTDTCDGGHAPDVVKNCETSP